MAIDAHGEILRLRTALRDLVALSTIPVAWVGREPPAIAAGLADVLVGSLHLDFAFVRLCDPSGGAAVEVTRGNAWKAFPEWLEHHLAAVGQLSRKEIIPDVGGGAGPCRGIVMPIGVNAEGGLVAAACERTDFPTESDQLLLSVAANHAVTAFQNAHLIHERRRAEQALRKSEHELRQARDELEMKVTERTAELRRSEAYLAEAQRLSHTGSWSWNPATGEVIHWSEEQSRLFGFDPEEGVPSAEERFHPEDHDRVLETVDRAVRDRTDFAVDLRVVLPDGTMKYVHGVGHPVFNASGDLVEYIGTTMDVTERKRAEEERERLLAREQAARAEAVAAQQRFADLVNSVEGIVWEADAETFVFSFVSKQAQRILGYPTERWLNEPTFWKDHLHPDDRDRAIDVCLHATVEKRNHDFECRMIAADGRSVWLRDIVTVVVEGDRATKLRGVMVDITTRKWAEEVLREQADLLNLTHDSVFVRDRNDVITYWNRGAQERYGWREEEAVGQVSHQLMQTIFPEPLEEINTELLGTGRWEGELVHTKRDGTQVVVASRWSLQRDERGNPVAILETNNDITERQRAEAALRESEEQWKAVFEHNPTMYFMVDVAGTILSVNPFGAEQLGYTVDALVGQPVLQVFYEADREAVRRNVAICFEQLGRTMSWEFRKVRKDGTVLWVRETARAVLIKNRLVILIACEDITERKRAEEALRRSEAYLAEAQRLSHTTSWAWNVATREPVYWSQELYRMFGLDPEQGIPSREAASQYAHPEDRARCFEIIERAIREKANYELEYRAVLPDGTIKYIHSIGHPHCNASGELVEFVGTGMDITERKRAEEERQAHLWFLESLERVNRAIQGTNDLEQMLSDVLDALLTIFQCDRAWLVYPCDPEARWHGVKMQRTRPEFPGLFSVGLDLPVDSETADVLRTVRAASGPVRFGPGAPHPLPATLAQRLGIQSRIVMALYPKGDQPYMFGLSQCAYPRVWTPQEEQLFQEIGRRLEDALTTLLIFRHLQDSEARLEEAQRIAHVGYWARDLDTDGFTWSDETYRIFGLPPQARPIDFAGWQDLIHPDDRQLRARAVAAAHGGARYDVEYRVVRPDGDVRIVHSQGEVRRDEAGRPRRMFGTVQDITERRRAEEALRESERRYRNIFETAGVSIWEEDFSQVKAAIDTLKAQGVRDFRRYLAVHPAFVRHAISLVKIIDVNDATVKLFGAGSKDELLVSLHAIFTPESQDVFAGELVAIAEGRTAFASEAAVQTLQGDKLTVLFTMTFPPQPATLKSVLVSIMDITERKRAEYLTEQVFESSPDGISIVGRDYRYRRVNPVYERNWGMPAERIVGMHIADLLGLEVFEQTVKPYLDRCFAGAVVRYGEWFTNTLGRQYLALSYAPLQPDAARVEAALVITRDLTEHMLASEALRQAQTELAHVTRVTTLGELATSIAHEINQPLAAIVTNGSAGLRWLARAVPHLDDVREALQCIIDDGQRASEVITRIRALLRKTATEKAWLDLPPLVHEVVRLTQPECVRQGVTLRVEVAAALPPVWGDRVQVQQVLLNLVMNGMEAMAGVAQGPRALVIRARPEAAGTVLVAVEDTGMGIAQEQLDAIFTAFYTTKAQGLGMGLAISRTIIEQHGGRLWAVPHEGPGATVQFTLRTTWEGERH